MDSKKEKYLNVLDIINEYYDSISYGKLRKVESFEKYCKTKIEELNAKRNN